LPSRTDDANESAVSDNYTVKKIFMSCIQEGGIDFLAGAFAQFGDFEAAEKDTRIGCYHCIGEGVEEDFCSAKKVAEVKVCAGRKRPVQGR
jgi:hypothetical protein